MQTPSHEGLSRRAFLAGSALALLPAPAFGTTHCHILEHQAGGMMG